MKLLFTMALLTLTACQQQSQLNWEHITSEIEDKFDHVEHISVAEFINKTKNNNDLVIIDVRNKNEYAVSHIPGAIHMTDPKEIAAVAVQHEKEVIVYCSVGYRSAIVAQKLQALDVHVVNLQGSIFAWANQRLPLYNSAGVTKDVHPYNQHWGQLLDQHVQKNYGK